MTGERLLVVDDSTDMRETLANVILKPEGFQVTMAENGAKGLALALESEPDLIVTDQAMPEMTGLQMLQRIREAGLRIPAILITGEGSEAVAVEALRQGVTDYFVKPCDPEELVAAVRRGLKQARLGLPYTAASKVDIVTPLFDLGRAITSSLNLEMVLGQVLEEAVRLSGAEEGVLMLLDPESEELYTRASKSADEETVGNLRLPVQDSLAGQVVSTGDVVMLGEGEHKIKTEYLVKSLLYVPLQLFGQIIGVLGVSNRVEDRPFLREDAEVLSALANYASIAIGNARAFEQAQLERARFRTMLERSSDAVIVIDEFGYVVLINQGACEALEVENLDVLGRPLNEAIPNADLRGIFQRRSNETITRGEVALADGRTLNAQLTDIEGLGRVAVMQDVTHLKELDRMKTQFVTTVSHDLRSPLTAILGYVEFITRVGEVSEQQADFIERIKVSVRAMTDLINDLLDLGRIEAGMDREKEPIRLEAVLKNVIETMRPHITERQQKFSVESPKKLPQVFGNALRLRQALSNLLDNAIKYTPEGGTVTLVANTTDEYVILQIRDTGVGIPIADQPHIFEHFYRAESVLESHHGTGLGLAIVKSIIDAHEGRIWVESKLNEGSTFTVMLPVYSPGKGLAESSRAP